MVYRDLQMEVAQQKFAELTTAPQIPEPVPQPEPVKAKRSKLRKGVPASK